MDGELVGADVLSVDTVGDELFGQLLDSLGATSYPTT
jgi:hypothetical protein